MFSFEIRGDITPELQLHFDEAIVARIRLLSDDFDTALAEHPETATPIMRLYPLGHGPFSEDDAKIKQTRIIGFDRPHEYTLNWDASARLTDAE